MYCWWYRQAIYSRSALQHTSEDLLQGPELNYGPHRLNLAFWESYFWYDIEEEDLYGWLDGKDDPIEEGIIMLEPGAGVWVKAPTANYSLVFPGVTLK